MLDEGQLIIMVTFTTVVGFRIKFNPWCTSPLYKNANLKYSIKELRN